MLKAIQKIQGEKMEKLNILRHATFSLTVMVGKLGCLLALITYVKKFNETMPKVSMQESSESNY